MSSEKISIIVPIYNTEKFLDRCLKSIISQTYKNLEIILVNDGSTDNSLKKCNKYKNKDKRVIIIDKTHTGIADTRNMGIEKATGKYIGFVDSDDYIEKEMFEKLVLGMQRYKADISMCDLEQTIEENEQTKNTKNTIDHVIMSRNTALEQLLYDKNIGNYMTVKLFKRHLFENVRFPIGRLYEDIATTYMLFNKADRVIYFPTVMYHYYQRKDSIINYTTRKSIYDYSKAIFDRYEILKDENKKLDLYNVYSIVNMVFKMSRWAIKIEADDIFENEIKSFLIKLEKEITLVNETELINLMTDFEKRCYYLRKEKENFKKYLQEYVIEKNKSKKFKQ